MIWVNKVLRRIQQPQPGTPGRTPYLFDNAHALHNTRDKWLYDPSEGRSNGQVSCLRTQESNPHSGDQKHQSLNSVLLKEHIALDRTSWSIKIVCNPFL